MSEYDMTIHQSTDAAKWAKFFIETRNKTNFEIDESLMIGWFANAMMAMHDHVCREKDQEITRLKKALEIANEAIGFYAEVTNNPKQYMRQGYLVYNLKKKIFVDGGEKAREAQKQIKEIMEAK